MIFKCIFQELLNRALHFAIVMSFWILTLFYLTHRKKIISRNNRGQNYDLPNANIQLRILFFWQITETPSDLIVVWHGPWSSVLQNINRIQFRALCRPVIYFGSSGCSSTLRVIVLADEATTQTQFCR